jgi:hypothetical protein
VSRMHDCLSFAMNNLSKAVLFIAYDRNSAEIAKRFLYRPYLLIKVATVSDVTNTRLLGCKFDSVFVDSDVGFTISTECADANGIPYEVDRAT